MSDRIDENTKTRLVNSKVLVNCAQCGQVNWVYFLYFVVFNVNVERAELCVNVSAFFDGFALFVAKRL